ncbi:hypothetical protein [Pseudoalteromonas galatheae]|uniref:hypothetical protein n=1 Tax=Pseudoalteromonas galatheae TaxID=579562 RepID=UPI0030D13A81
MEYIAYITLPTFVIGLLLTWSNVNSRWFFSSLLIVELLDDLMLPIAKTWTTHYYLWAVMVNIIFLLIVLFRKVWAAKLYSWTGINYFKKASGEYKFSQQEGAICFLFIVSMAINFVTWIEILLYVNYIIDTPYVKLYLLDAGQSFLHILVCLAIITYLTKIPKKEKDELYEGS